MRYLRDVALWLFGLIALAVLVVSAPASYRLIALYHSDGTTVGVVSTWALLLILEAGAVAAKLATLWAPGNRRPLEITVFSFLAVNTLSNWIHGANVAVTQGLGWITAWFGALIYAAFLPGLLWLMLWLLCARVERLRGIDATAEDEAAAQLRPITHAVALANAAQRSLAVLSALPQLPPPQEAYPRPEAQRTQPVLTLPEACPACGTAASPMQLRTAAQHGGYRCKECGKKVLGGQDGLDSQL